MQHQQQVVTAVERAKQVSMSELNAIIGVSYVPIFYSAQLSEQPLLIQFVNVCRRLPYSFLRLPPRYQGFVRDWSGIGQALIRHSLGIRQNCLRILVDRKAFRSCFSQFSLLASCRTQCFVVVFLWQKKRRGKGKNSITYYSPSSFVLWLAAAMFSGTIVVTVEKPQLPSSQFPFFWLECCWPKEYCTVMHFVYFLSSLFVCL